MIQGSAFHDTAADVVVRLEISFGLFVNWVRLSLSIPLIIKLAGEVDAPFAVNIILAEIIVASLGILTP